jgi:hypothetical protein
LAPAAESVCEQVARDSRLNNGKIVVSGPKSVSISSRSATRGQVRRRPLSSRLLRGPESLLRHALGDPREEPSAGKPIAQICEGEAEWLSYSTTTSPRI